MSNQERKTLITKSVVSDEDRKDRLALVNAVEALIAKDIEVESGHVSEFATNLGAWAQWMKEEGLNASLEEWKKKDEELFGKKRRKRAK